MQWRVGLLSSNRGLSRGVLPAVVDDSSGALCASRGLHTPRGPPCPRGPPHPQGPSTHSQLFWLRTQCPQLPAIRRGPTPGSFREMSMSPRKSSADRWNWAERQVLAVHWKTLTASWFLEFQRTDCSALLAPHPAPSPLQGAPFCSAWPRDPG